MASKNEPCPCGSGKKFKRCCMGKSDEASADARRDEALSAAGALRHEPVIDDDGFRVVTREQAMIHYVRPLLGGWSLEGQDQARFVVDVGEACWTAAMAARAGAEEAREQLVPVLERAGIPEADAFVDRMITRHRELFPRIVEDGENGPYREAVLPESWFRFEESALALAVAGGLTGDDRAVERTLGSLDTLRRGETTEILKAKFFELLEKLEPAFPAWLVRGGAVNQAAEAAGLVCRFFVTFLYQLREEPLDRFPEATVDEFLQRWIFRNANLDGTKMSLAPASLACFAQYLDALGHTKDLAARMDKALAQVRAPYFDLLARYFGEPQ